MISAKLVRKNQLIVEENNNRFALQAANKTMMSVVGTVEVKVTTRHEPTSAICYCLVSEDLVDDMLVSRSDLVALKRLHDGFPNTRVKEIQEVVARAVERDIAQELLLEFQDVFSDELDPTPMQTGKPMHISLLNNSEKPFKTLVARRVPLRFEEEANKTIKDLIQKGVIVPVTDTTDWCSPAFFVAKADGVRVRLVTDYTRLNRHVKRPVHPFPSTKEIIQAIPHGSKWLSLIHI